MQRLTRWILLVVYGVCSTFFAPCAFGWEFDLGVNFNWAYEWYNQQGHNGFFGPYNVDNGPGNTANLNFWNGGQFDTNMTTSASAGWSYFYVEFLPQFKVNPAIKFDGKYRISTWGKLINDFYHTQDAAGVNTAFSDGQWTMFWVTAQTPWGIFGIGKRPWEFGTGLQYDMDGLSTESMVLVVPYGPLDIGIGYYPYRFVGTSSIPELAESKWGNPFDLITVTPGISRQYFSRADKSGSTSSDVLAYVTYSNGPLHAGIIGNYGSFHIGPEAPLELAATQPVAQDSEYCHGSIFSKYNNGRFFLNAEAAWVYWTDRYSDPTGLFFTNGIPDTTRYVEQWRYMVELGSLAGPAKISFLFGMAPGPDRRNGTFIDRQPAAFVWHPTFDAYLGNFSVFRPYAYLIGYDYGSGLNAYNLSNDGYIRDASVLAVRIDYAVAANLNVFGTFAWAERTSNGYSWGCIGPNAGGGNFPAPLDGDINFNFNRYPASPNIPDRGLGYEMDTGFDWKLLEGFDASMTFAYWRPGKWFNYACIDRSVPGWQTGTAGNFFGTRPGRNIDPVIGGQFNLIFSF
ncbi:MAG: hypothetical protein WBG50_10790 [Desulfomonilaceae bacterium]